jgi:murein DD-endopeptidase MepM/ murein hydrolase activator NlpD
MGQTAKTKPTAAGIDQAALDKAAAHAAEQKRLQDEKAEKDRLAAEEKTKKDEQEKRDDANQEPNFFEKIFGFFGDMLSALIGMIFGNNLDKGADGNDVETNTSPSAPADNKGKTFDRAGKIGRIKVSDQAEQKRLEYMAAHKGEKVEFHSPVCMNARVASGVGPRNTGIKGASTNHAGADIAATGDVLAAANGVVIVSGKFGTAGNTVIIAHPNGTFTSYMHMKDGSAFPSEGTEVLQGQKIGIIGNTSTIKNMATHLHFEVRNADRKPVEPEIAGITLRKGALCKGNHSHSHDYAGLADRKDMPKFASADVDGHDGHNAPGSKPKADKHVS